MSFKPIIDTPKFMDSALFLPSPMGLRAKLISPSLDDRITWDNQRDLLFIDFENYAVKTTDDVVGIQHAVEEKVKRIGKRVNVVVNYDGCAIDEQVVNEYVAMVKMLETQYYNEVLRYSSSVFTRVKLGLRFIEKGIVPNLFNQ